MSRSSPPRRPSSLLSLDDGNGDAPTDKQANRQQPFTDTATTTTATGGYQGDNMEEGVDIHAYEDSLHHYSAYAFDVTHAANAVVIDATTGNPLEEVVVGTKRPFETTTEDAVSKRHKNTTNNEKNSAAATNKQWDAMFERLVAFKDRNGVRTLLHSQSAIAVFWRLTFSA